MTFGADKIELLRQTAVQLFGPLSGAHGVETNALNAGVKVLLYSAADHIEALERELALAKAAVATSEAACDELEDIVRGLPPEFLTESQWEKFNEAMTNPKPPTRSMRDALELHDKLVADRRKCEKCGEPVYPPSNRYMAANHCLGDRVWHGHCFPPEGVSGTFTVTR